MDNVELSQKLLDALRSGGLPLTDKGFITGFRGHVLSEKFPHLPSEKQINIARNMCRSIRYEIGPGPANLIDEDDNPEAEAQEREWAEF